MRNSENTINTTKRKLDLISSLRKETIIESNKSLDGMCMLVKKRRGGVGRILQVARGQLV